MSKSTPIGARIPTVTSQYLLEKKIPISAVIRAGIYFFLRLPPEGKLRFLYENGLNVENEAQIPGETMDWDETFQYIFEKYNIPDILRKQVMELPEEKRPKVLYALIKMKEDKEQNHGQDNGK